MKRLLASIGIAGALGAATVAAASSAHADPTCQFLGQNYNVYYDCLAPQPWLPYGTGNNPPLGGSAVTRGGDGPTVNGVEPGWAGPNCGACSS